MKYLSYICTTEGKPPLN